MVSTTPTLVPLTRDNHVITLQKGGHRQSCLVTSSVGAGWIILDVFGGLVGIIVDAATNAWTTVDNTRCHVEFDGR